MPTKRSSNRASDRAVEQQPRTTAMGLLTDAKEMLTAAGILHDSGVWKVNGPTYYLLGHATEVALKSFLLACGCDLKRLKDRYGHDIAKAARRVIAARHDLVSPLVEKHLPQIELLNVYYKDKELEYRVTGFKRYPPKEELIAFLRMLIPLIEPMASKVYPDR
jgi:hypothetical protein